MFINVALTKEVCVCIASKKSSLIGSRLHLFHTKDGEPFSKVSHLEATKLCSKYLDILGSKVYVLKNDTKKQSGTKS